MKRLGLGVLAFLLISCVSQPVPESPVVQPQTEIVPSEPAIPSGPVRKERLETYTVPVVIKETVSFADGLVEKVITYTYDEGYKKLLSTVTRKPNAKNPLETFDRIQFLKIRLKLIRRNDDPPLDHMPHDTAYQGRTQNNN